MMRCIHILFVQEIGYTMFLRFSDNYNFLCITVRLSGRKMLFHGLHILPKAIAK
jgi:hypothetical protein